VAVGTISLPAVGRIFASDTHFSRFQVKNNMAPAKLDVLDAEQAAQARRN